MERWAPRLEELSPFANDVLTELEQIGKKCRRRRRGSRSGGSLHLAVIVALAKVRCIGELPYRSVPKYAESPNCLQSCHQNDTLRWPLCGLGFERARPSVGMSHA